jgi:hypothetical protein
MEVDPAISPEDLSKDWDLVQNCCGQEEEVVVRAWYTTSHLRAASLKNSTLGDYFSKFSHLQAPWGHKLVCLILN